MFYIMKDKEVKIFYVYYVICTIVYVLQYIYCTQSVLQMYCVDFYIYHNYMCILRYNKYPSIVYCDENTNQRIGNVYFEGP